MSARYPSWAVCARTTAADLELIAKRLRVAWSVESGNDGYSVLYAYSDEPNVPFARRLAVKLGEPVVVLNFDDDLYYADQIHVDGSEKRLVDKPPEVLASHGITTPGGGVAVTNRAAFVIGVDRAAVEAVSWQDSFVVREVKPRGLLITGGPSLAISCGRWSRELKCEVFVATWEPAACDFLCMRFAPGVNETFSWVKGRSEGEVANATSLADVLRTADIPPSALGMEKEVGVQV